MLTTNRLTHVLQFSFKKLTLGDWLTQFNCNLHTINKNHVKTQQKSKTMYAVVDKQNGTCPVEAVDGIEEIAITTNQWKEER